MHTAFDGVLAAAAFAALLVLRWPSWLVVGLAAAIGFAFPQ
jgi:hypothetical protein